MFSYRSVSAMRKVAAATAAATAVAAALAAHAVPARADNGLPARAAPAGTVPRFPAKPSELFNGKGVWEVHLRFTREAWDAMEPKGGPGSPGNDFGPGTFIAPSFLKDGDANGDGKLSRAEWDALSEKWFARWDKNNAGALDRAQLHAGLNASISIPGMAPPGPGGRRPGLVLQGAEGKRNGIASVLGVEFDYVRADLEMAGQVFKDVAVRYKGNGTFLDSRGTIKRPLKVDLEKHADGRTLAGVTQINLHNNVTDASWMNESLSYRLFRDAGVPTPRTAYARVFVTVPGLHDRKYFGLYSLVEDVGKEFLKERFGTGKGALLKPVTPDLFADLGDDWKRYNQTYDPKTGLSAAEKRRVIDLCRLVTHAGDDDFAARIGDFIDLDGFARYMAVLVSIVDLDGILGPGQNFYLYLHPKTRKFQFIPWDMDHSFGQFGMRGTQEQRELLSVHKPWQGDNRFLERIFRVPAFKQRYLARLDGLRKTLFTPERIARQVDELAAALRPAVREESEAKLARFDMAVAGKIVEGAGFRGQPSTPIKAFVPIRARSVADQLAGRSEGQTLGEFVLGGGPPPGDPDAPGDFGPGTFLAPVLMAALDADKDAKLTRAEMTEGFGRWFAAWNTDNSGVLTRTQLSAGINKAFAPPPGGPPPPGAPPAGAPPAKGTEKKP